MTTTLAHKHDSATSYLAARDIVRSGKHASDCRLILETIRKYPGLTAHQIGKLIGFPPPHNVPVSRRISSLQGLVKEGPKVKCPESGRYCTTYYPAERLAI